MYVLRLSHIFPNYYFSISFPVLYVRISTLSTPKPLKHMFYLLRNSSLFGPGNCLTCTCMAKKS